jgi:hypothetical protein
MDGRVFDELTKHFAGARSRRSLVRAAGGGIAAAVLALRAGGTSAACPPDQVARRGQCVCRTTGRPPIGGVCPCPVGKSNCDGLCVNLHIDEANCGACGTICAELETCFSGECTCLLECCADEDCPLGGPCLGGTCDTSTTVT